MSDEKSKFKYFLPDGEFIEEVNEDSGRWQALHNGDTIRANTIAEFVSQATGAIIDQDGGTLNDFAVEDGDCDYLEALCKAAGASYDEVCEYLEKGNDEKN